MCDQPIVDALMNSDIQFIDKYINISTDISKEPIWRRMLRVIINIYYCDSFNPSNELLEYLLQMEKDKSYELLHSGAFHDNFTLLERILLSTDKNYKINMLIHLISRYSYSHIRTDSRKYPMSIRENVRSSILMFIENMKNKLTFKDIQNIKERTETYGCHCCIIYDIYFYILHKVIEINESIIPKDFKDMSYLIYLSVQVNVPRMVTQILLKHIENDQDTIDDIGSLEDIEQLEKPDYCTSLFSDDV